MAAGLDGRIADQAGGAPAFTSRYDRHKLFRLRAEADVLLVGANTVRQELLPPLVRDAGWAQQRADAGKPPHPAVALVSRSLDLPWDSRYFSEAQQQIFVMTSGHDSPPELPAIARDAGVDLIDAGSEGSLRRGLEILGQKGFPKILAEGGGKLNHSLLREDLIDIFYLTLAPVFIGGEDVPGLCDGPRLEPMRRMSLSSHERVGNELHLVYKRESPE